METKAKAEPTKDFFVRMITKDIALEDCILDLLDNCVDGAARHIRTGTTKINKLQGYQASLDLSKEKFVISDNCGGISLDDAVNYAFRFGRRKGAEPNSDYSIGLYGIGMKRALFKIGREIRISSKTKDESFVVPIDADKWSEAEDWDFDLEEGEKKASIGTKIEVSSLFESISAEFEDTVFINRLIRMISRDYSFIIQNGFDIRVNGKKIKPYRYELKEGDEISPLRFSYNDDGVEVEIVAGLSGALPEDTSPDLIDKKNVDYFGWFVACNDRIVIAGSKSDDTVWGNEDFSKWHPQYNGFMGIVRFNSRDASKLPWTTTKREIDTQSPLYRRALVRMKKATRAFLNYSNQRKEDLDSAKKRESAAKPKQISSLKPQEEMRFPEISTSKTKKANILYSVERERAKTAGKSLGNLNMAYAEIGRRTFEYYFEAEVEE